MNVADLAVLVMRSTPDHPEKYLGVLGIASANSYLGKDEVRVEVDEGLRGWRFIESSPGVPHTTRMEVGKGRDFNLDRAGNRSMLTIGVYDPMKVKHLESMAEQVRYTIEEWARMDGPAFDD